MGNDDDIKRFRQNIREIDLSSNLSSDSNPCHGISHLLGDGDTDSGMGKFVRHIEDGYRRVLSGAQSLIKYILEVFRVQET
jgi:hypothetical protein